MKHIYLAVLLTVFLFSCQQEQKIESSDDSPSVYSLAEELRSLYDVGLLPSYDSAITFQASSYDTTGGNDDGFSGRYSYLERNADSSLVIFDVQGAGVINRIWTPTPTEDTLDFYLDHQEKPAFSVKFSDLFSGNQFPFVAPLCGNQIGGFFCYLPIPFSKGCKIVSRGKKIQFHQIQYRLYPKGSRVKTFEVNLNDEEKEALTKVKKLWDDEDGVVGNILNTNPLQKIESIELAPGESTTIFQLSDGGRILGIELGPSSAFVGIQKNVDIRITWDDEKIPAVYCPVADFFGYAFGSPSMQSLLMGSRKDINYFYFPMPFDESAKIELLNRNHSDGGAVKLSFKIYYDDNARDIDYEGKFYARWNNDRPASGTPYVFLHAEGRGHYVGTVLQAQGLKAGMTYFFEGDDSTVVDGTMRIHGTGSEDYFNGGWYAMLDRWDGAVSLPLHGSLDYSIPFCRSGGYRLYMSDKISFTKNIFHSIEHGPKGNQFPVNYTSLALFYCDRPLSEVTVPTSETTQVFLPDTLMLYPQLMEFTTSGKINFSSAWKYNTGGESYTFNVSDDGWLRISLDDIPNGKYKLFMDLINKADGCEFSVWQRQTNISPVINTFNTNEKREENLYICDMNIDDLRRSLTLRFNTSENRNSFLLNRLIFVKQN